jgi:hypothetical protein
VEGPVRKPAGERSTLGTRLRGRVWKNVFGRNGHARDRSALPYHPHGLLL